MIKGSFCHKNIFPAYTVINGFGRKSVRRVLGLILFWVAIGMLLMMLIGNNIVGVILVAGLLIAGYNLFCL
jgi:hypothetical protein